MIYTLKDLLDVPRLRELMDSLDEIHSMPTAILDTEGNILTASGWQDICTKFHRMHPDTEKKCIESDRHIEAKLGDDVPYIVYRCPMGLVDAAMPIIIEGKHLGNVFTGQLFIESPDESYFKEQAHQYGFNEHDYLAAMRKVPFFTEEKLHRNLDYIGSLTQMLAEQGLLHLRQCETENTLRESEAVFRHLFEDMNDPILLLKEGRFIDCNAATLRLLGYNSKPEFLDRTPADVSPVYQPDGRTSEEKAAEMIATALQSGYHRFEWTHSRADNSSVPVEVTLTAITIGGEVILHTLWRDITDRKQAEEALMLLKNTLQEHNDKLLVTEESLREQNNELICTEEMLRVQISEYEASRILLKESEERFQALHDASFGGIAIHDNGIILDCNQGLSDISGYTIEELVGMNGLKLIAPEWVGLAVQHIQSGFDQRYEVEGIRKNGTRCPLSIKGKSIPYKGRTVRVTEFRDITELKQAEEALRESEAHYRLLTESVSDVVWKLDSNYRFTYISPADERLRGYKADEVIGHHVFELFDKEGIASLKRIAQQRQESEQNGIKIDTSTFEAQHRCKDGRWLWAEIRSTPERDAHGAITGYHGITREITERKAHEKEQLKIEKLESLGILAGGIAHDFNNILAGIMGNISIAQMFLDDTHKSFKPLVEAEKASVRATELAHQLLTFARGGEPVKKLFSLQHLANETVLLSLHGSNVKGIVDIPDSVHAIEADEGQISQLFHNIIINALQAMPGGGTLTVTARNEMLSDNNALSLISGTYACLTFSDQGCGIPDNDLKKIFDPYFTTKLTGNGLGLASAHSIVKRHGGHIGVSTKVGKGTTFTIHLPSIGSSYTANQIESVTQTIDDHPGSSILVMDDEKMIRNMTTEMLEYLGYQVTTCENGADAVTLYKTAGESGAPFSAVIMDLTIPGGMGGKETAQQILAIDPKACLIVSSGYSNDPVMSDFVSIGFTGAVAKPYNIKELGKLLGSLLPGKKQEHTI